MTEFHAWDEKNGESQKSESNAFYLPSTSLKIFCRQRNPSLILKKLRLLEPVEKSFSGDRRFHHLTFGCPHTWLVGNLPCNFASWKHSFKFATCITEILFHQIFFISLPLHVLSRSPHNFSFYFHFLCSGSKVTHMFKDLLSWRYRAYTYTTLALKTLRPSFFANFCAYELQHFNSFLSLSISHFYFWLVNLFPHSFVSLPDHSLFPSHSSTLPLYTSVSTPLSRSLSLLLCLCTFLFPFLSFSLSLLFYLLFSLSLYFLFSLLFSCSLDDIQWVRVARDLRLRSKSPNWSYSLLRRFLLASPSNHLFQGLVVARARNKTSRRLACHGVWIFARLICFTNIHYCQLPLCLNWTWNRSKTFSLPVLVTF